MKKRLMLALMLALTPTLCRALPGGEARRRCPPVFATLLGAYLILCAMIIPHMYSSGYAGSGRVVNMYHSFAVLFLPVAWCMALLRLPDARRERLARGRVRPSLMAAGALALALCVAGGQLGNYVKLVRDQLDGTQDAYIAQFRN